jgi:hypothetical protein
MNTETFTPLSLDIKPNLNWFEVWSLDQDGSLKNCANFYDFALQNSVAWAIQCLSQEISRTDDAHVVVHSTVDKDKEMVRSIIPAPTDRETKFYTVLNKLRAGLKNN